MFQFASRFFRQRSLVEEAAQEVFLKAFTELGKFEGRGSMEGWLTRITTNTCLNLLRSSKRRPELTVSHEYAVACVRKTCAGIVPGARPDQSIPRI